MAAPNTITKNWQISVSSDGKYYSAYPNGDAVAVGDTVLTGFSGAGAKSVASPVLFDDFDDHPEGAPLLELGYSGSSVNPKISSDRSYTGTKSAKHTYGTGNGFPKIHFLLPTPARKIYVALHAYWEPTEPGLNIGIFKVVRGGALPAYSGMPKFHETITDTAGDGLSDINNIGGIRELDDTPAIAQNSGPKQFNAGDWHFLEYYFDIGTPNGSDAEMHTRVDGAINRSVSGVDALQGADALVEYVLLMFNGLDNSQSGLSVWQQNFYVDTTGQRVILTDSADYEQSTRLLVQEPTAWSDNEITVVKNLGGGVFEPGEIGFFHVFDESGNHVAAIEEAL